jgi:YjbE family integral membrane protein
MAFLLDPEFWARWLAIVLIDLSLAGDNALVIALAVRTLPPREQFYGRLGGTFGAVALRLAFIAVITQLLRIPFLQAAGGLVLIWIAIKLVRQDSGEPSTHGKVRHGTTLWEAIWIIILADVIMSLDNVLAVAAAAHGDLVLVAFGIALSIPIVIWGSGLLARLMNRFQWIVWLGGGVLGWVAGEMIVKDKIVHGWIEPWSGLLHWAVPAVLGAILTLLGWWLARRSQDSAPEQVGTSAAGE